MDKIKIFETTKIINKEMIDFGHDIIIDDFCFIYARKSSKIGNFVHIGCFSSIAGGESFFLDDFSGLSHGCRVFTSTEDFTGNGFGNPTISEEFRNVKRAPVSLGRFAVVGANSVILPGVTIGEGATVAANSVVTKDLDPWGVYVGNRRVSQRNKDGVLENYARFVHCCKDDGQ